ELSAYPNEAAYRAELYHLSGVIERQFHDFVDAHDIDFLIPQNIWSVGVNPAASIALARVMLDRQLPALAHNHDFYWEREDRMSLTCATAIELADLYLPPRDPLARHVVINTLAQRDLLARKGIPSTVVPNVFDFHGPDWQIDDWNRDLRQRIGLRESDVVILQATRIVPRKGIELAVDFVAALDTPERRALLQRTGLYHGLPFHAGSRIVLVVAGYARDDLTGTYLARLKQKIDRAGVDALFIDDLVDGHRHLRAGQKIYSLWDTYVHADLVTYPSLGEGWGNQFLEAVRARLPMLVFEYPVYQSDIKPRGFRAISLGSEVTAWDDLGLAHVPQPVIDAAADQAIALLGNHTLRQEVVDHNHYIGSHYFSMHALAGYLSQLVPEGTGGEQLSTSDR
ncbi:MAG TPA: glycosyltransferase, partial [Anaerolineae bacterium]|nr:glycosyltransferase [Anaerolineae bacterium]